MNFCPKLECPKYKCPKLLVINVIHFFTPKEFIFGQGLQQNLLRILWVLKIPVAKIPKILCGSDYLTGSVARLRCYSKNQFGLLYDHEKLSFSEIRQIILTKSFLILCSICVFLFGWPAKDRAQNITICNMSPTGFSYFYQSLEPHHFRTF